MSGEEFKELREGLGLSIEKIAANLAVSVSLVYSWENGNRKISEPHKKLFCTLYNIEYKPVVKVKDETPWLFSDYPES